MKNLLLLILCIYPGVLNAQADSAARGRLCGLRTEITASGSAAIPVLKYRYESTGAGRQVNIGTSFNLGIDFTFNKRNRMFAPIAGVRAGFVGFTSTGVYKSQYDTTNRTYYQQEQLRDYMLMASGGIVGQVPLSKMAKLVLAARTGMFIKGARSDNAHFGPGICSEITAGIRLKEHATASLRVAYLDSWFEPSGNVNMPVYIQQNGYHIILAGIEVKHRIPCHRKKHR